MFNLTTEFKTKYSWFDDTMKLPSYQNVNPSIRIFNLILMCISSKPSVGYVERDSNSGVGWIAR